MEKQQELELNKKMRVQSMLAWGLLLSSLQIGKVLVQLMVDMRITSLLDIEQVVMVMDKCTMKLVQQQLIHMKA